ncbi:polysaccharide biosynthesis/export family protein [Algivirga pacifica]|uniref:Polysaccharide export outer membrane protein n=1 Tax=Algivirga pacifica TaxID=1162670 RepID=A0ABP9D8W5_9BACT
MSRITIITTILTLGLLSSCSLKKAVLFQTPTSVNAEVFEMEVNDITKNYTINYNDYLAISVYTNKGERLIDPNNEFSVGNAPSANNNRLGNQNNRQNQSMMARLPIERNSQPPQVYSVDPNGEINLPMVGKVKAVGLNLFELDAKLVEAYEAYYRDPFVISQYTNKRVLVMGALGEQIVYLYNEKMTVLEVLTSVGGILQNAKANKIRLVRPDPTTGFKNASVQLIDLTTIDGLKSANLKMMPNDVLYVEPRRRFDSQNLRDATSIIGAVTSTITGVISLYLLIQEINK